MAAPKKAVGPKSDKEWRDAIRLAVHEVRGGKKDQKALRLLAERLVDKALEGDVSAMKEIGDRLDGKPAQSMALSGKVEFGVDALLQAIDGKSRGIPEGG